MKIVEGHAPPQQPLGPAIVAIGNFDGVHLGHQHLLAEGRRQADAAGAALVALTFDPHPARVLAPQVAPALICSLARRLELLAALGVDVAWVQPFSLELAAWAPAQFVERLLVAQLGARGVVVGYDFTFGQKRSGTTAVLQDLGRERGIAVTVVPAFSVDGEVASSSRVRALVRQGDVAAAARLLGRDFELDGVVVRGAGRGRQLGYPTANLRSDGELQPAEAVYAGWASLGDGSRFAAAVSVGSNPTFGAGAVTIEAYLLDASLDLYDRRLRVGLTRRLRAQERFASVEALTAQIDRDVAATRTAFADRSAS